MTKNNSLPVLAIGWLLAAAIAGASLFLSRKSETRRVSANPEPVRNFAADLQAELDRLEDRYEIRVGSVFRDWRNRDNLAAQEGVNAFFGLESVSMLYRDGSLGKDSIFSNGNSDQGFEPILTFRKNGSSHQHQLNEPDFFDTSPIASGWFSTEDDGRLHYWERRGKTYILVATINPSEVREVIDPWLGTSQRIPRHLLESYHGTVRIGSHREGKTLWELPVRDPGPERPPDHVLPVKNNFGTWLVSARDPVEMATIWRWPVLGGGLFLAASLALASLYFASAYREATRLAEQRVSFVNRASHELRSPITNILLHSDLAGDFIGSDDARAWAKLDLIREEAGRLSRLVDNVLTFSQTERGTYHYSIALLSPDEVIRRVIENFEPTFRRCGIEIETDLDGPDSFPTDPDALAQIATNLLSNVEKYAASGSWVKIETRSADHSFLLRVADRGPGIPESARRKIFRPFQRLSNDVSEGVTGTGLGLAIAHELAEGLGGGLRLLDSETGAIFEAVIFGTENLPTT